jgi:hypothetical protein
MPETGRVILLGAGLVAGAQAHGLFIEGRTTGGMAFAGETVSVDEEAVHLDPGHGGATTRIGVPLASIAMLSFGLPQLPAGETAAALENMAALLPHCDSATLQRLLQWAESRADAGDWTTVHLWATRLAEAAPEGADALGARILLARSLEALGLFQQLEAALAALNEQVPPLRAPLQLCRLNARVNARAKRPQQARFWAELPALRIPAAAGPLANELAALAAGLQPEGR